MRCEMSCSLEVFASEWGTLHFIYYALAEGSLTIYARLPEIDPEEEEMQQAQLQLQQQQQNDGEQQHAANPPPPPPQPALAPRAESPVARRASPPRVVQRQPPPPRAQALIPRADSARSDTARADRLAKIQRMLEAEASEAEATAKSKAAPPAAGARNDIAMDEDEPTPFLVQNKQPMPAKASTSRVDSWIGSRPATTSASARMEIDEEDDNSFDLTPSQELAMNEAMLRDLERDLARRSASPMKRAASPQKRKRKLDTAASASLPAKRAPAQTQAKVINLVDSGDEDDYEPPPASSSKPKPVPRHTSRVPSTPVSKVRPHRKALPRERSKTVEAAEVIDLSD